MTDKKCNTCGQCGHFMRYDGQDHTGDCGSIAMNKECNDGRNPFNEEYGVLLQVDDGEKACALFRTTRTPRVRQYIKDHPKYYEQLRQR